MKFSTSIYGPSAKHEDHELKWKNNVGQLTEQTEKTKLVACLLQKFCFIKRVDKG